MKDELSENMRAGRPRSNKRPRSDEHREWHSRGYLPHFDRPGKVQMITFRLADALPGDVVEFLRQLELKIKNRIDLNKRKRRKVEACLDQGYGSCTLRDEAVATLVENSLLHFDHQRYRLLAWVIMPNHVHALVEIWSGFPLENVLHSWKSYTSHKANRLLNRSGQYWQEEYFDRFIRNQRHYHNAVRYIQMNPVKAGLVNAPEAWPFSSAARRSAGVPPA